MPTVRIRFPAGRYHATLWGSHVNEGQIEWPPSPWRLLRALLACGYNTQQWLDVPEIARTLIGRLAKCLPSYRLPLASAAHSRHYMPVADFKKPSDVKQVNAFEFSATNQQSADIGNFFVENTTLVYDTWANVDDDDLIVHWNCYLSAEETVLLKVLVDCLGYLGRSESWVEAELINDSIIDEIQFNAFPSVPISQQGRGWEQITMIAAIAPEEYFTWRSEMTNSLLSEFPLPQANKKPTAKLVKDRERIISPYPSDLIECLQKDTAWWKQHRWSQPPGSQRIVYWRRSDSLEVGVPARPVRSSSQSVTTMLLAIMSPSGNRSALPSIKRTLPQADLLHRALVGRTGNGRRVHCPELTGKDANGEPLKSGHQHAHILPVDLDNDGYLDHIIIHSPMGLGDAAQHAVRTLRRTWTKGGVGEMQLALAGAGDLNCLRGLPEQLISQVGRVLAPKVGSRIWTSVTPFVPARFLKPRGKNTLENQIATELESRGFVGEDSAKIQVLPWNTDTFPLRHFIRVRQRKAAPPVDVGYAIRIEFATPQKGPICLGYASHFGLGLFGAVLDDST